MSKIDILFFGPLIQITGKRNYEFTFGNDSISLKELKDKIYGLFPQLKIYNTAIAINHSIATDNSTVSNGDEVAFLPPISGGNLSYLTNKKITPGLIDQLLTGIDETCGSIIKFEGIVRADKSHEGAFVEYINYTAYEPMAEKVIHKIVNQSITKYGLIDLIVIHRLGKVRLNQTAFFVAVSSSHRKEGIAALDYIIDEVKNKVPIWKEEIYSDSTRSFKSGEIIN